MNTSLKTKPVIAEILPGSLVLILFAIANPALARDILTWFKEGLGLLIGAGLLFFVVWIVGAFFDSVRNLLEYIWDRIAKCRNKPGIGWDFFFKGDRDKVEQLDECYYAYYKLDANFVIGISFFVLVELFHLILRGTGLPVYLYWLLLFIPVIAFLLEAVGLRTEITTLIPDEGSASRFSNAQPHSGVYARLKRSNTHGVGVFAIRCIPKGANLFAGDTSKMVKMKQADLEALDPELRSLYEDFCVINDEEYYCPDNFNNMTMGWYLNHSKEDSNVRCVVAADKMDYEFFSMRRIEKGEELLVDYETYSDLPASLKKPKENEKEPPSVPGARRTPRPRR
jgi:hypothetical protein